MLLCPLQTQTSPKRTSVNVALLPPASATFTEYCLDPPLVAGSLASHELTSPPASAFIGAEPSSVTEKEGAERGRRRTKPKWQC